MYLSKIFDKGLATWCVDTLASHYYLTTCLVIMAFLFLIAKFSQFLIYFKHQFEPHSKSFWEKYFLDDSWVAVTGAAEGAGRAFAEYFAEKNANLVLFDIQENQLNQTAKAIKEKYKVKIKTKVVDFSKSLDVGFFETIREELKGLDLAIIINNVGVLKMSKFEEISCEFLQKEISVNCSGVGMTFALLPYLLQRTKRSAIVTMSSWQADIAWPYVGPYSATKAFVDSVSRELGTKYREKIDFISLKPFGIRSRMSGNFKMPFMEEPDVYVKKSLRLLGKRTSSYGNLAQCFISILLQAILPGKVLKRFARLSIVALERVKKSN